MFDRALITKISHGEIADRVERCVGDQHAVERHPLGFIRVPLFREEPLRWARSLS